METIQSHSDRLEEELKKLGLKIKHHEDNLKFLKSEIDSIDESIFDMQVSLGKYHSSIPDSTGGPSSSSESEQQGFQRILDRERSAAGIICQMKSRHGLHASKLALTKDVIGIVATLGKVRDENLSRSVKSVKTRNHRTGSAYHVGHGRYRPFSGEFVPDDPQRKLALHKPRLANGELPPGFMGYAVNMISLDHTHLSCLTASGSGLRETLFYNLFGRLQVYKTRADVNHSIPLISDGAISLDGGIIKSTGLFYLGDRSTNIEIEFPISHEISNFPTNIREIEEQMKLLNWRKERLVEDSKREEYLLNRAKNLFSAKKQEIMDYLSQSALAQLHPVSGKEIVPKFKNSSM